MPTDLENTLFSLNGNIFAVFCTSLSNGNSVVFQNKKVLTQNFPQDSLCCTLEHTSPPSYLLNKVRTAWERGTRSSPFPVPMSTGANGYLGGLL